MKENTHTVPARLQKPLLVVSAILILGLLFFANYQFGKQNNAGIDFLIRWMPARLILQGELNTPYALEATEAIQYFRYGRLAEEGEIQGFFLYPYYFLYIIFPFGLVGDYLVARALWMTFLEVLVVIMLFLNLKILNFSPQKISLTLLILFFLVSPRFLQPIVDANPAVISAFFAVLTLYFLWKKQDILAGIMLGISTIKPQMVIIFWGLVFLWVFSTRRWKVILSASVSVLVLIGSSFLFYPDWFMEFMEQLRFYQLLATPNNPSMIIPAIVNNVAEIAINSIVVIVLGISWHWCYGKQFPYFFWTALFSFSILPLTSLPFGNRNLVVLIPAIILILFIFNKNHPQKGAFDSTLILLLIFSWLEFLLPVVWRDAGELIQFINYLPFVLMIVVLLLVIRKDWLISFNEVIDD